MSTSVCKENDLSKKIAFVYLIAGLFTAFFGAVYEQFSFGVWSPYMVYAFAIPLLGGALPYEWAAQKNRRLPCTASRILFHAAVATLTVGCLMKGVLDIYGTTHYLLNLYGYAGAFLFASGLLTGIIGKS